MPASPGHGPDLEKIQIPPVEKPGSLKGFLAPQNMASPSIQEMKKQQKPFISLGGFHHVLVLSPLPPGLGMQH